MNRNNLEKPDVHRNQKREWVFFDIGGVLINDFSGNNSREEMLQEIGAVGDKRPVFDKIWDLHKDRVDIDYDVDDLALELNQTGHFNIPAKYSFLRDGFASRFGRNPAILPLMDGLRDKFQFGLITNMYPGMLDEIKRRKLMPEGYDIQITVDSSIEKTQKPDPRIYKIALERVGTTADKAYFIDDKQENVDAANELGMKSFLYDVYHPEESSKNILYEIMGVWQSKD
jgi:haloacid dehalogenase superfamily, subfamily IA, variant 3 with third motif having DD or ED